MAEPLHLPGLGAPGRTDDAAGYRCLLLDPPWEEVGGGGRGAQRHYDVMSTPDILRTIVGSPLWRPAASAHLWMWATANFLSEALFLIEALGFTYKTFAVWVKPSIGQGRYLRLRHEPLLLAVRGKAIMPAPSIERDSVIEAARGEHSVKPEDSYTLIERVSPGPRAELFSRRPRDGWDVWGNDPAVVGEPALVERVRGVLG